ncbi:hypothetical protein Nocox_18305 [Nonomuraea coxensis DSM 45129]|uniref:Integral membrane protein n=1 Tax=Nonomuraea coxensis DSM 45129 TaxID=1122611 RepID=A0ABX8U0V3_9ACTN|nr:hypothetical protein [Nonomuraea coxensis]QYC41270.1 hypothetical protein Nocox_18305 [Nonomuraea coxensis DSM 45129]
MDGFLDDTCGGLTELRVHGVSGTPPQTTLHHPHPWRVAGDAVTGFYRRWWPEGRPAGGDADVPGARRREAYAWGGLTSGGRALALWLPLLPFSLVNLAYFMLPRPPRGRWLRRLAEAALRLFALLLTGTMVGAVTRASVDLFGWQCTAPGRACTLDGAPAFARWLAETQAAEPSRRLAVAALAPLLVVGLLWWLGRRTWRRDEQTVVPPGGGPHARVPLARPRLWHGGAPVWRLRAVHVSFAAASVGLAVSGPFAATRAGFALTVANAAVQAAAALLVVLPPIARRLDPHTGAAAPAWLTWSCQGLRAAAALALAATGCAALAGLGPGAAGRQLPGIGAGAFQHALTLGLGLFLLAAVGALAVMDRPRGHDPVERRALGGLSAWAALMLAAGTANVLALGLLFWTAGYLGEPGAPASPGPLPVTLFLDDTIWWTAALVPLVALGALAVAAVLWRARRAESARLAPRVAHYYGERNAQAVAAVWGFAALTDRAGLVLGVLTGVGVAGYAAVTAAGHLGLFPPVNGLAGALSSAGSWALVAVGLGLVLIGRRTYRDSRLRRTVGILWDVATFWPRAVHPLGPPCYAERVVPELVARVGRLARTDQDQVIVSGHSQGSVIAAALVLQLKPELRRRVALLTHGSPLRRLYAAFFPAWFGAEGLAAVRAAVPWHNLYRLSDPIGGPVFRRLDPFAAAGHGPVSDDPVDRYCWDPRRPALGEPLPEARWHSDYWLEPSYDVAFDRLVRVKTPA